MPAPPPPDGPPVGSGDPTAPGFDAGFKPSPTGTLLCGIGIPSFFLTLNIPGLGINFPPKLPTFFLTLSINCDLSNPISADAGFGGGRKPSGPNQPF